MIFLVSADYMTITGDTLTFDLDFTGNQNLLFGTLVADTSTFNLDFSGDSNEFRLEYWLYWFLR